MGGSGAAQLLVFVVFVTTLVAQWRAARVGLGYSAATSVLMILSYFIAQTMAGLAFLTLLAILHGGELAMPFY
jgi:hypothetical protein